MFKMIVGKILMHLALLVLIPRAASKLSVSEVGASSENLMTISSHKSQEPNDTYDKLNYDNYNICDTKQCKKMATEFIRGMNTSMDPCDDFYEYACGGWSVNMSIPSSATFWNHDTFYQNIVRFRLKKILETKPTSDDILPVKQAKKWYRSCMDTEMRHKRGLRSIETLVMQAGGWPMSMEDQEWDSQGYPWQRVEGHYVRLTGIHTFYDVDVNPIPPTAEDDFPEIRIGPPKLLISRVPLMNHKSYKKGLMTKVLHVFRRHNGAPMHKKHYMTEIEDLIKFELALQKLVVKSGSEDAMSFDQNTDRHNTNMTLEQFADWYQTYASIELNNDLNAKIEWMAIVQRLFEMADIRVDPSTPVYVNNFKYIKGVGKLLKRTEAQTIVNYVHWNFIASMLTYTTEHMRDSIFMMRNEEFGVVKSEPRWLECTKQMKMIHAAAYIFADKYFTKAIQRAVLDMLNNVKMALMENIETSTWLDDESKAFAKDKVKHVKVFMGIPDWYRNATKVINYYKGINIRDDYFDNVLNYMRYEMKQSLKLYVNPVPRVDETTWYANPITVNAEYGTGNTLNLPPVNFQPPLFMAGLPDYINYGQAGFTIGHEMGHSFDHKGILCGKNHAETELSDDTLNVYDRKVDCFVKQFEGYFNESESKSSSETNNEQETRGWFTRGENIADSIGLQAVFHAYKKLNKQKPIADTKLPGLETFSGEQLFFVSYAAAWCGIERPEYTESKDLSNDPHSSAKIRIIGAVSNTQDFATVFNCPKGSPMNPINKCSFWKEP